MKGTPFYTGEYELSVPNAEVDRVNVWPLVYYRAPALSVLWPVFEKTEEHLAVRPLYSAYGDTSEYWEHNTLWPLGQLNTRDHDNRFIPYFWGTSRRAGDTEQDYHVLFPLYWHFEDEVNALLPLWYIRHGAYEQGEFTEHDYWFGGPLARYHRTKRASDWHVALFGRHRDDDGERVLAGYPYPLFMTWRSSREAGFFSPLYARNDVLGDDFREGWAALPPLLSLRTWSNTDDDFWLLGPLVHFRSGKEVDGWHAALFGRYVNHHDGASYAGYPWPLLFSWRSEQSRGFFSPAFACQESIGKNANQGFACVPPLLSWHTWNQSSSDYWLLGPLGEAHAGEGQSAWRFATVGRYENSKLGSSYAGYPWPLVWTWRNPKDHGFFSPLFAYQSSSSETVSDGWLAVPLLLSWRLWDPSEDSLIALLGLFAEHKTSSNRTGHLAPLYAYNRLDGKFYTPLAGWNNPDPRDPTGYWYALTPLVGAWSGDTCGSWLHPLYSHKRLVGSEDYSTRFLALGYASQAHGGSHGSQTSSFECGLLPLYMHEAETFSNRVDKSGVRTEGSSSDHTYALLAFSSASTTATYAPRGEPPPPGTNTIERMQHDNWVKLQKRGDRVKRQASNGLFPLWMSFSNSESRPDGTTLSIDDDARLLLLLFDSRRELQAEAGKKPVDYTRRRILWRLWHYEKRGGDVSVDIFPFTTYDAHADGFRKTSFLWRFYRYETSKDGKTSVDLLFIPLRRD